MLTIPLPLTGKKLPPGWIAIRGTPYDGFWQNAERQLRVIASVAPYGDGKNWLHLSMSHRKRIPTYDELTYLKRHWIGDNRKAVMVLPAADQHVNIHPYCLHLFCCLDEDPLPEFSFNGVSI